MFLQTSDVCEGNFLGVNRAVGVDEAIPIGDGMSSSVDFPGKVAKEFPADAETAADEGDDIDVLVAVCAVLGSFSRLHIEVAANKDGPVIAIFDAFVDKLNGLSDLLLAHVATD